MKQEANRVNSSLDLFFGPEDGGDKFLGKVSVNFQRTARRYTPGYWTLHNNFCENLKSYMMPCSVLISSFRKNLLHPSSEYKLTLLPWKWKRHIPEDRNRHMIRKLVSLYQYLWIRYVSRYGCTIIIIITPFPWNTAQVCSNCKKLSSWYSKISQTSRITESVCRVEILLFYPHPAANLCRNILMGF
jgi:hypothetical protein